MSLCVDVDNVVLQQRRKCLSTPKSFGVNVENVVRRRKCRSTLTSKASLEQRFWFHISHRLTVDEYLEGKFLFANPPVFAQMSESAAIRPIPRQHAVQTIRLQTFRL